MKNKLYFLRRILTTLCIVASCISTFAFTSGPLRYEKVQASLFAPNEARVYGPERDITTDIEIPYNVSTSMSNWKVTSIRDYAFDGCRLTGVKLSPALRSIGFGAFQNCTNLKKVETSKGLKFIEGNAFNGCSSLETFQFPESLKLIGEHAFRNCEKLQSVVLQEHVAEIRQWAFYCCRALNEVVLNCPITEIPDGCFNYCTALTEIKIPDTVRTIGEAAFEYSGLQVIHIGRNVSLIKTKAFSGSNIHTIYLYTPTPPQTGGYIVNYGCEKNITLHIPVSAKAAYTQNQYWKRFNIVADL